MAKRVKELNDKGEYILVKSGKCGKGGMGSKFGQIERWRPLNLMSVRLARQEAPE